MKMSNLFQELSKSKYLLFVLALAIGLTGTLGCGESDKVVEANSDRMKRLYNCYLMYMEANNERGPKSAKALKKYLLKEDGIRLRLERMGVDAKGINEMFTSERDNEPFVVRWGLEGMKDHAIVFEAVGVNGRRLVAFSPPREVGDNEYKGLLSGKIETGNSNKSITITGPMTKPDE